MLQPLHIATLLEIPGLGKKTVLKFLDIPILENIDINILYDFYKSNFHRKNHISFNEFSNLYKKIEDKFEQSYSSNVKVVSFNDSRFPKLVKNLQDSPVLFFYKGDIECLSDYPTVAVIGTREPSQFGYKSGERFGEFLAQNSITIVSGLAIGCDTAGHRGCLKAGGKTVAILAHGLHTIYPKQNIELSEEILLNGGCLISEYLWGENANKYTFVERDRLQSGLSFATIVVETDLKGGTMHTVKYTQDQRRILYCLDHPHDKRNVKSNGNEYLLNNNSAKPISNRADLENLVTDVQIKFNDEFQMFYNSSNYVQKNKEDNLKKRNGKNIDTSLVEINTIDENEIINGHIKNSDTISVDLNDTSANFEKFQGSNSEINQINETINQIQPYKVIKNEQKIERLTLNIYELMIRFKLKSTNTIKNHLKKNIFYNWSKKKDPRQYGWNYDESKNLFVSDIIDDTDLFN